MSKHSSWDADRRTLGKLALAALLSPALSACLGDTDNTRNHAQNAASGWPRKIQGDRGEVLLQAPPKRIVSTSITLTGTLLAIGAPVIASGAGRPGSTVCDEQGFFHQWGDVARSRKLQALYHGEPSAEAVVAANPDLIVVSATGGDSALRLYEQLQQIAPVLVLGYDDKNWQTLARLLGQACGLESAAEKLIAGFDKRVSDLRDRLQLPPQPVSAAVYAEDNSGANVWTSESAQGQLLEALGFSLAAVPAKLAENRQKRRDVIPVGGENFAAGLAGQSLLLFSADDNTIGKVKQNPFLASAPAVRRQQVYQLGRDTFRLDFYSASNMLNRLEQLFARPA